MLNDITWVRGRQGKTHVRTFETKAAADGGAITYTMCRKRLSTAQPVGRPDGWHVNEYTGRVSGNTNTDGVCMACAEQAAAAQWLRDTYAPGDRPVIADVRRIGSRVLRGLPDGDVQNVTPIVARACGFPLNRDGFLFASGFNVAYAMGRAAYPDGHYCTGHDHGRQRCPSNDHVNGDRMYSERHWHSDGGYALSNYGTV